MFPANNMKSKFIIILLLGLGGFGCFRASPHSVSERGRSDFDAQDGSDGQRLVSLLDYVSADYGGAVRGGEVISAVEYEEQISFVETALKMADHAARGDDERAALRQRIERLKEAVGARLDPSAVASLGRVAREEVVARLGLVTTPLKQPDLIRAQTLYAESCATCHGQDGLGQTEVAASLDPRPANFKNATRRRAQSPYRIYNALTLGVPGTAMPAFDALSSSERWDLAFYVLRLAHDGEKASSPSSTTLAVLAARSDDDILSGLKADGHPSPEEGLAFARRDAPFVSASLGLGVQQTRALVRKAASLAAAGRNEEADRVVLDAYLDGFEPLEAQINARDPNRTQSVEIAFRDLRAALVRDRPALVQKQAALLDELLSRSDSREGATLPFVAAFVIYFREGIEAALLVGALLGGVRKLRRDDARRAIHLGWTLALLAGGISGVLFSRLVAIAPAERELIEAVVGLLAALVLFSVSFWMISKAESRKWMAFLQNQMNRGLNSGRVWSLSGLAFLAVYRECAETILFTEALLIESAANTWPVFAGASVGLACVILAALAVQNAFQRLPMPLFFGLSGLLLSLLATAFAGSAVSAFVAAGYLRPRPILFPSFPMLGIHPDLSSLCVQGVLILMLLATGAKTRLDSRAVRRT
jgi:high-affinity iron transporter